MDKKRKPIYMLPTKDSPQVEGQKHTESEVMKEDIPCKFLTCPH